MVDVHVTREELARAAQTCGILPQEADLLWQHLQSDATREGKPKLDLANLAYYLGALIVIGAMGWFMTKAWELFGGRGISAAALAYGLCFLAVGSRLWRREGMRIPAGLLLTMAVCMVPLLTYGIERWTGWWPADDPGSYTQFHPYINGSWLVMEGATVIAGVLALCFWRFPFLTAPVAYALWFMSMDIADLLRGHHGYWEEKAAVSAGFGAVVLAIAYLADLRGRSADFAFWGYLFGLLSFWGGLTAMHSDSEIGKLVYCAINIVLLLFALILRRGMFLVFGGFGVFIYLSHLAYDVFKDSMLFPLVLSVIGLGVMYLGVQAQRKGREIGRKFRGDWHRTSGALSRRERYGTHDTR
jgi:hypothetical protein